jgi:prevent-host-death family protein
MDRYVTATEANQNFSKMLRDVRAGYNVIVTSRGRPVAKLSASDPAPDKKSTEDFLAWLRSRPPVNAGPWKREDLYERPRKGSD